MESNITIFNKEELENLYWNEGLSTIEIAKRLNSTKGRIQFLFNKLKIKKRTRNQAKIKYIDIGTRFHYIVVRKFLGLHRSCGEQKQRSYYECICDCGTILEIDGYVLKQGRIKSCGCKTQLLNKQFHYKGGKYIGYSEYRHIYHAAKRRNRIFEISIKNIEEVFEKQNKRCKFSGVELEFNKGFDKGMPHYGDASVDRIDSSKGYTKDNIQIVHKKLNIMKQDMSDEEFIDWCRQIVNYQDNKC